jgi:hypothetical protein
MRIQRYLRGIGYSQLTGTYVTVPVSAVPRYVIHLFAATHLLENTSHNLKYIL